MFQNRYLIEFFVIFMVTPILFLSDILGKNMIMPVLWITFLYTIAVLYRCGEKPFAGVVRRRDLLRIVQRFLIIFPVIVLIALALFPQHLFDFVIKEPVLWAMLMVAYPIISVLVQEIVFRRFFFWRYGRFFSSRGAAVLANAALFAYAHTVFLNPVAVILSFAGGVIFALTYLHTRSLWLVTIEHSLYGNTLFTIGLGTFFYHGTIG